MNLYVTPSALRCFVKEWGICAGDNVRIYARYGQGASTEGAYSLGIARDLPKEVAVSYMVEDVNFFVDASDTWFLDGRDLVIDYDATADEIVTRLS